MQLWGSRDNSSGLSDLDLLVLAVFRDSRDCLETTWTVRGIMDFNGFNPFFPIKPFILAVLNIWLNDLRWSGTAGTRATEIWRSTGTWTSEIWSAGIGSGTGTENEMRIGGSLGQNLGNLSEDEDLIMKYFYKQTTLRLERNYSSECRVFFLLVKSYASEHNRC